MSGDAAIDWVTALGAALAGDATLAGLVGTDTNSGAVKVFGRVPAETPYPFIAFGDIAFADSSSSDTGAQEFMHDVHIWDMPQTSGTESPGTARIRQIQARVYAICHRPDLHFVPFAVANQNLILCQVVAGRLMQEADALTNRATITLRVLTGH